MAVSRFQNVRIAGVVSVVPPQVKKFSDELGQFDITEKQAARIKKNIGLDRRHVVDDETTSLDLCCAAARDLFDGMGVDRDTIECLIFVTQTPDHFQPANAAISHGVLGMSKDCASFDVNLGCSGWVYGLWLAHMMIENGASQRVLLLAGDTLSKCVGSKDRSVAPLFGDCGTATLLERSTTPNPTYFSLHTDGSGAEHIKVPAGAFRMPATPETAKEFETEDGNILTLENLRMNGGEVFNFSINVEPKAIESLLEYAECDKEDLDYIVFHQANKYIISNIVRRLKIPIEKAPMDTVETFGNQSSASIPCTINNALSAQIRSHEHKVVFSGFGVGLSWASCLTNVKLEYCPEVRIFEGAYNE